MSTIVSQSTFYFNGKSQDYIRYRRVLIQKLKVADSTVSLGLLGSFTSSQEYKKHSGGREFVPLNPNVIDRPLPPIQNRSESDPKYSIRCKVFEYQLAEWDRNERLYLERSTKEAAFVVLIHASLASTSLRFITKDDSPMRAHHKIMQVLDYQ